MYGMLPPNPAIGLDPAQRAHLLSAVQVCAPTRFGIPCSEADMRAPPKSRPGVMASVLSARPSIFVLPQEDGFRPEYDRVASAEELADAAHPMLQQILSYDELCPGYAEGVHKPRTFTEWLGDTFKDF